MRNFFKKNQSGFTVFELLVSVAIIGTIATIFITNVSRANREKEHITSIQDLGDQIRTLQNWALSSREFNNNNVDSWFLYMNRSDDDQYYIYFDSNDNHIIDGGELVDGPISFTDNSIRLNDVSGKDNSGAAFFENNNYSIYIFFYPPDSRVRIDVRKNNAENTPLDSSNYPNAQYLEIFFQQTGTAQVKSATINQYGLFDY